MTVPATDLPRAVDVAFDADSLVVTLADGRKATAPLDRLPRLKSATPDQRSQWTLSGGGLSIRWQSLDEDLSVPRLAGMKPHVARPGQRETIEFVKGAESRFTSGDWRGLLTLTRQHPWFPDPAGNHYLRASCLFELDDFDGAAVHFQEAFLLQPENKNYVVFALWVLERQADFEGIVEMAEQIFAFGRKAHPRSLIAAAAKLLAIRLREGDDKALPRFAVVLREALPRHNSLPATERIKNVAILGYAQLAVVTNLLGEKVEAVAAAKRALDLSPRSDLLAELVARVENGDRDAEQSRTLFERIASAFLPGELPSAT